MKILLVTDTLLPGGAELFVLRLAQALHQKGFDVRIFNLRPRAVNREKVRLIAPDVTVISPAVVSSYLLNKIDSLLYRVGVDFSILRMLQQKALKRYCRAENVDVIHSHLFVSDYVAVSALNSFKCKKVITIHGDYLQYPKRLNAKERVGFLNYTEKLTYIVKHVNDIVVITDEQKQFFNHLIKKERPAVKISKIYNGYSAKQTEFKNLRPALGIKEGDFVFGMIARGIEEKGWSYLIQAFEILNKPNARLVLVGEGKYLDRLRTENNNRHVHFAGFTTTPLEWVNIMDVGLFASYIKNEGLPTTIIEYLFLEKPVVTTNVGECKKMIMNGDKSAGFALDLKNERPDVKLIAEKMKLLMDDRKLVESLKQVAARIKPNFDMMNCVNSYLEVYTRK
jgi:glycosyltransferase involved in cell wall biosynthesis